MSHEGPLGIVAIEQELNVVLCCLDRKQYHFDKLLIDGAGGGRLRGKRVLKTYLNDLCQILNESPIWLA